VNRVKFKDEYKELNTAQKLAVDSIEGPVMVVAGPGTGKTQVLTLRIANILRMTDVGPDAILALTFTESAAHNLRERLVGIVGPVGYRVGIFTFHSFCNDVIKRYSPHFPSVVGYKHANLIDQIIILKEIIKYSKLTKLKPFGDHYFYVREIVSAIGKLKRENIDAGKLEKLIRREPEERGERNKEFLYLYREYQKALRQQGFYDYDDMIMEVIRMLKADKELLRTLQEEYQYVLADEHQDANNGQNELLELLMSYHKNPNIFVVGDAMQAIFRFQGASLENFEGFKNKFKGAKVVTLTHNYRSRKEVLMAVGKLGGAQLVSAKIGKEKGEVSVVALSSPDEELFFVLSDIEKRIKTGAKLSEIAILYRDNKDVLPLVHVLEKGTLPFVIESDQDILGDYDIRKLITILRAVDDVDDPSSRLGAGRLADMLHVDFLNIDSLDIYKFLREKKISFEIQKLARRTSAWHKVSKNKNLIEVFEIIVRESGFLSHLIALSEAIEKMEKLNSLFDELKTLVENHPKYSLHDFLLYLDLLSEHNVMVKKEQKGKATGIRLMTAHRSKGQEFDIVYVIGAVDGHWGGRRVRNHLAFKFLGEDADIEDERRLFYVALSRARERVMITHSQTRQDGKSALPSRFIPELKIESNPKGETLVDTKVSPLGARYAPKVQMGIAISDKEYLNALFREQGLSVSALGNYLECPWRYFYVNLLRIPTALESYHMYGIAIHAGLHDLYAEDLTKPAFLSRFTRHINEQPLGKIEGKRAELRGRKALSGYFEQYYKASNKNVITELAIKGVLLGDIKLTGRLDKLELLDTHGSVNVVDYKTGKPKSRNEIIKSGYERQLIFYKILLDRFANSKYKMLTGEIDFVEPNERGFYKKEKFEIADAEVLELTQKISEVSKQITDLTFWKKKCEDKKCPWCALRAMMK